MSISRRTFKLETLVPLCLLIALFPLPAWGYLSDSDFYVAFFARILIYGLAVTALNIALGFGGLVSLGHALFLGLGAYSVAIPSFYGIDNGFIHLGITLVACALTGLITGAISLRTSGMAFIMITLAFAQMGYFLFVSLKVYGGDDGLNITNTSQFFGLNLDNVYVVYAIAWVFMALSTWWIARLRVAPFGMILRAARQHTRRTNAIGFNAQLYLLVSYVLSAMMCGVAGMLLANLNAYASPTTLSWIISGDLVVMLVLGGLGTVFGPLLGAMAFLGLEEVLKIFTDHWLAVFGLVIVVIGLVGRTGLIGLLRKLDTVKRTQPSPRSEANKNVEPVI